MCPRAGKLWGVWAKNGRKLTIFPRTFILGRIFPRTFRLQVLIARSFPSTGSFFRASVLRAKIPTTSASVISPMPPPPRSPHGREASAIRTRLNVGHIRRQPPGQRRPCSSAKTTQTNVGNSPAPPREGIINKEISTGSAWVLQKLGKKLNNVPITTAGSKLFCRSAGPNFARKSTFWLDTAQKHTYTNNVEMISIGKLRLSTLSVLFGRSSHLVRS